MLIDSHAHLDGKEFDHDRKEVLEYAFESGIEKIINIGFDFPSSQRSIALAEEYEQVYAAVGFHPHDAKEAKEGYLQSLQRLAAHPKVVAIGEIGLDYYYNHSDPEVQRKVFVEQIGLARELKMPVIIHNRDAHGDTLEILQRERGGENGGVLHCFSGSWEMAKTCMDLGFYISLAGPVTFKNARKAIEVAVNMPLSRLLVETDCPYLTPEPYRGKRNEPAYVRFVAERIAELKGVSLEELAAATKRNTEELFGI